ncbi:endonuclease domain-containing protein [Deinococcus sp. 23YEL01]|uniref:endonuclease domain-containing protein n=1 Tax=Deinococcus sp. 23YEL01 TaxID=2745871 RepID=UPI00351D558F
MVAVELDGSSHSSRSRQAQDQKKDALLRSLGWTVLRWSNKAALSDPEACARAALSTTSK